VAWVGKAVAGWVAAMAGFGSVVSPSVALPPATAGAATQLPLFESLCGPVRHTRPRRF
jgi:hypothetical protein